MEWRWGEAAAGRDMATGAGRPQTSGEDALTSVSVEQPCRPDNPQHQPSERFLGGKNCCCELRRREEASSDPTFSCCAMSCIETLTTREGTQSLSLSSGFCIHQDKLFFDSSFELSRQKGKGISGVILVLCFLPCAL